MATQAQFQLDIQTLPSVPIQQSGPSISGQPQPLAGLGAVAAKVQGEVRVIHISDFVPANLRADQAVEKTFKPKEGAKKDGEADGEKKEEGSYYVMRLNYLMPHGNLETFRVEYPQMTARYGINSKPYSGYISRSIGVILGNTNPDSEKIIAFLHGIHRVAANFVQNNRPFMPKLANKLRSFHPESNNSYLKEIPLQKVDSATGVPIPGKAPSLYFQLYCYERSRTLIEDPLGNKIPWEILEGNEFDFIPVVDFEDIYCGSGEGKIRHKTISMIVTRIVPNSENTVQEETKKKVASDTDAVERLRAQIAALTGGMTKSPAPITNTPEKPAPTNLGEIHQISEGTFDITKHVSTMQIPTLDTLLGGQPVNKQ